MSSCHSTNFLRFGFQRWITSAPAFRCREALFLVLIACSPGINLLSICPYNLFSADDVVICSPKGLIGNIGSLAT